MSLHFVWLKYLVDEHEPSEELGDGRHLRSVDNPGMRSPTRCQTQEVHVLSEDSAFVLTSTSQVLVIRSTNHVRFCHRQHIHAALT